MAFTHSINISYFAGANRTDVTTSATADSETSYDIVVPNSSSAYQVSCSLDVSQIKSLLISADAALTIKTNSAGSPDQTISLVANTPITWISSSVESNPLTVDTTQLFVSCSAANVGGNLVIRSLNDSTV